MKCARCPLYTSWNTESDRVEMCGIFGDGWDSPFQYEDSEGTIIGCYIDRHFIEKTNNEFVEHLKQDAVSWEKWMLDTEKAEEADNEQP